MSAEKLQERDGDSCRLCGLHIPATARKPHPLAAEVDHILPISRGGTHDPENLALTHKTCNIAKGNKSVTWRRTDPNTVASMLTEWTNGGHDNRSPTTCSVTGCERRPESHGMCQKHRRRVMKHGAPELPPRPRSCTVARCGSPIRAKGLCRSHYRVYLIDGKQCTVIECDRQIHARQRCRIHYQEWLDSRPGHSSG
ncbi:HNH endonuclease [Rhodococcus qingshengii]|uniref:HNH endonuclease n=2 Tax=Rhodococcus TaxID=1827 RepID=UPI00141212D2